MGENGHTRTIQSDERLFDIIEYLKREGESGITELSDALDLSKSTVHGHLATLVERGYILKNSAGRYRLGLRFLDLGATTQRARQIYDEAKPKLREVADQTGEKAWCIVEENGEAVFLAVDHGEHAVPTTAYVGERTDLYRLAGGKSILANLPESRRDEIIAGYDFPLDHGDRNIGEAELREELATIRDRGVAFNNQVFVKSIKGIGAPIVDADDRVHGAISISGPANRLEQGDVESEHIELLIGVTSEVGVNLSYQ